MGGKFGITKTIEFFDLGLEFAKAGQCILKDGKADFSDIGCVIPVIPKVASGFENMHQILDEIGELDEEESENLLQYARGRVPDAISDQDVREKILVCIKAGIAIAEAISAFKPKAA